MEIIASFRFAVVLCHFTNSMPPSHLANDSLRGCEAANVQRGMKDSIELHAGCSADKHARHVVASFFFFFFFLSVCVCVWLCGV